MKKIFILAILCCFISLAGNAQEYKIKETPRYKAALREIDRQNEEGALTKTEYIQRKRLLNSESEKILVHPTKEDVPE